MNKRKICFVSMSAYPLFNQECKGTFGGAEVQLYNLARELSKNTEFDVNFIVGDYGQSEQETYGNIRILKSIPLKKGRFQFIAGAMREFRFLRLLKKINCNIYIQRAAGLETGMVAFFCKFFKKKFVYMAASSIDVDGTYKKKNPLKGIIYEYGLKNATRVLVQGEEYRNLLKKKYNLESAILKNSFLIPEDYNGNEKKFVLWVGSSQTLKHPEIYLEIAMSIPGEKFIMIMPKNNEKLWKNIYENAKEIINLEFIEKVSFNKVGDFYKEAKLLINTSDFEGFPNTFVQASMFGTPIVSLNVNPDDFLGRNNCGFYAENNLEKLKIETRDILRDKSKWTKLSKNAYSYARENHDIQKMGKRLAKLLEEIGK